MHDVVHSIYQQYAKGSVGKGLISIPVTKKPFSKEKHERVVYRLCRCLSATFWVVYLDQIKMNALSTPFSGVILLAGRSSWMYQMQASVKS